MLTAERLRELLNYDPETGVFTRRGNRAVRRWKDGQVAGWVHKHNGYALIRIGDRDYFSHRLAWLYVTGDWPRTDIDHIDGIKTNNAFHNLREATEIVNAQNQKRAHRGTKSGILGVYPKGRRWMASICVDKVPKYLGTFDTADEAHATYLEAKRALHPGCTI